MITLKYQLKTIFYRNVGTISNIGTLLLEEEMMTGEKNKNKKQT